MTIFEFLLDSSAELDTIHHGHHYIGHNEIHRFPRKNPQRLLPVIGREDIEVSGKKIAEQQAKFLIVIHEKDCIVPGEALRPGKFR